MGCSVDLGHGCVRVVGQDVCVLRPLELVEQLGAQHDVKVLADACDHLIHSIFSVRTQEETRYTGQMPPLTQHRKKHITLVRYLR